MNTITTSKRKPKVKPELSIFDDELNVRFNPDEFLPDLPKDAKETNKIEPGVMKADSLPPSLVPYVGSHPLLSLNPTGEEIDYKQTTNRLQTDYKQTTNASINGSQTDHKQATAKSKQTTQQTTQQITTRLQTDHKRATNCDISALVGHERHLLLFIFNECRVTGERVTDPLTLFKIKEALKTGSGSTAKTIIARLIRKGFILRGKAKTGRGGWMTFRLEQEIFQRLLIETDYKRTTNRSQTDDKQTTKQTTQRATEPSSSSSKDIDLSKLTTTGDKEVVTDLPSGWAAIDHSPLSTIRFGQQQLVQLARIGTLTADQVQESINAFAFDLEVNEKVREISGHALNYFMGILRKGPYAPPSNYESPEVRQMRLYLEAKEREQKIRIDLESRLESVAFDEWTIGLTVEERIRLVPATDFAKPGSQGHNVQLKQYFRENIWPERKEQVLLIVTKDK